MEKKIFYTLQQRKGVKGVRKECGYELEIATRKFYGYVSADQTVYIIDPRNGIAIMSCDTACGRRSTLFSRWAYRSQDM